MSSKFAVGRSMSAGVTTIRRGRWLAAAAAAVLLLSLAGDRPAHAQTTPIAPRTPIDNPLNIPDVSKVAPPATDSRGLSATLQLLVLLTVLTLAPAILVMVTCFTRIVVVLALLRQALATQQLPPNQVIIGLALFMTLFVMAPTWEAVHHDALSPYLEGKIDQRAAMTKMAVPVRAFMIRQIEAAGNEADVRMFLDYRKQDAKEWADVPTGTLIPAFIISELKVAFIMGFRIYLPFLIVDLVIASVLISMGMMMLPPVLISLPFKLLLFVLVNGWHLVVGTLLLSFG
ncbi:MAG: flagellar type III secretion system pore protein FliP [Phycisphaerae bacterium]|nr:flagellar type III secretion system pore protein FliP [Phycisphaerae bacterium]